MLIMFSFCKVDIDRNVNVFVLIWMREMDWCVK